MILYETIQFFSRPPVGPWRCPQTHLKKVGAVNTAGGSPILALPQRLIITCWTYPMMILNESSLSRTIPMTGLDHWLRALISAKTFCRGCQMLLFFFFFLAFSNNLEYGCQLPEKVILSAKWGAIAPPLRAVYGRLSNAKFFKTRRWEKSNRFSKHDDVPRGSFFVLKPHNWIWEA